MGIQLSCEVKDLEAAGWEMEVRSSVYPSFDEEDDEPRIVHHLWVKFPQAGWVQSYAPDYLCFDNRTANMHLRAELDAAGIPYIRG